MFEQKEYGQIYIYTKPSGLKRFFLFGKILDTATKFIFPIPCSESIYLETGHEIYDHYSIYVCRPADAEEIRQYNELLKCSDYSEKILKKIKEYNFEWYVPEPFEQMTDEKIRETIEGVRDVFKQLKLSSHIKFNNLNESKLNNFMKLKEVV